MIPVYETSDLKNLAYIICDFESDCILCSSFHVNPHILPCEHIFCLECIKKCHSINNKLCPLCNIAFKIDNGIFQVVFEIFEEIKLGETIVLRKSTYEDSLPRNVSERSNYLFCNSYYIQKIYNQKEIEQEMKSNEITRRIIENNLIVRKDLIDKKNVFYQAENGIQIYLNQVECEKLKKKYNLYRDMPDYIVIEVKNIIKTFNDKNMPIYSHLDYDCNIKILEGSIILI